MEEVAVPGRLAAAGVEADALALQHRRQGVAAAPGQGPDAGHQLAERERLAEVVVCAQAEPVDPVVDRAQRRQHQDPGRRGPPDQGPADLVAVDAGKVAVQHDHVVAVDLELDQRVAAVVAHIDGQPLAAQPAGDGGRQHHLVLDDQHPHGRCPPLRPDRLQPAQGRLTPA
jgi:hypothetical protein